LASFSLPCRLPPFRSRSAILIVSPRHYHELGLRSTSRLSGLKQIREEGLSSTAFIAAQSEAQFAATRLWVPETLLTSRDLPILVEQSTEPVVPLDGVRILRRPSGEWS
jgi:hypothetical protein